MKITTKQRLALALLSMRRRLFKDDAETWTYTAVSPAQPSATIINLQDRNDLAVYNYAWNPVTKKAYTHATSAPGLTVNNWTTYYWWTGGYFPQSGTLYLQEIATPGPDSFGNFYDDQNTTASAGEILGKD